MAPLTYLSVCSGIEAATVAWHPLGWQPVGFAETEKFPSAVLAHHYPTTPNLGDITRFKEWPDARFDLLAGGTPCQSFSVAGLRKGLDDPRGNLALTYCAILDRYRPDWFVWENVPGVLSIDGGRAFGSILGAVAELGYGFAYRVLDAQYVRVDGFGRAVPQRRRRVFVVGHFGDWRRPAAVLFERESLCGNTPPRRETGSRIAAGALGGTSPGGGWRFGPDEAAANQLIPSTGDIAHCLNAGAMGRIDYETETMIAHPLTAARGKASANAADLETYVAHSLRADGFDASEDGTGRGTPLVPVAFDMRGREGGSQMEGPHETANMRAASGGSSRSYLAQPVADTLTAFWERSKGAKAGNQVGLLNPIIKNWAVRRLTPTECERLQGFPDGYTNLPKAADGPRYKALGNSMAVNVMRWLGRRVEMVRTAVGDDHD